ncbi:MAG: undecaprenyl-phosphate glucose phosphotransferase [Psychromonas sp.]
MHHAGHHTGFIQDNTNQFSVFLRLADFFLIQVILFLCLVWKGADYNEQYIITGLVSLLAFALFSESIQLYRYWPSNTFSQQIVYILISWMMAVSAACLYLFFTKSGADVSRLIVGFWLVLTGITLVTWRILFRFIIVYFRKTLISNKRVAILGLTDSGIALANELIEHPESGYSLRAFFDDRDIDRLPESYLDKLDGRIDEAVNLARQGDLDVVYIALPLVAQSRIERILRLLGDTTVNIRILPNLLSYSLLNSKFTSIGDIEALSVTESPLSGNISFVKRIEDIIGSLIILSVICLPMLVIGVLIKLDSKGPVIFKQRRYGLDGKAIEVWKFRTMSVCENGDVIKQATKNDSRVTRLGSILRRTSLDELPQFINVLQGSMSIVGPRPHAVAHNEQYRKAIDFYMLRHKVKPGITGWAQINGWRGETDTLLKMEKRVEYDLEYIRQWTFLLDIKIIFLTVLHGFNDKNAL